VKLIPRLLDPPEGTVLIGDTDIRGVKRSSLRKALGIIPQDVFLFSDTIRANIVFSRPDATDEDVQRVVDAAGLRSDLPFFPQGLETPVGEKGVTLSGGQKQRIAIARALIADPEILVLDDALSAVDAETEERILMNLFAMREKRTTLMISHRVSALSRCRHCVVLENGRISDQGTHEELMERGGFYREIADLQRLEHIEEETA
jgi:ATP-binding cassette subfamily B protein